MARIRQAPTVRRPSVADAEEFASEDEEELEVAAPTASDTPRLQAPGKHQEQQFQRRRPVPMKLASQNQSSQNQNARTSQKSQLSAPGRRLPSQTAQKQAPQRPRKMQHDSEEEEEDVEEESGVSDAEQDEAEIEEYNSETVSVEDAEDTAPIIQRENRAGSTQSATRKGKQIMVAKTMPLPRKGSTSGTKTLAQVNAESNLPPDIPIAKATTIPRRQSVSSARKGKSAAATGASDSESTSSSSGSDSESSSSSMSDSDSYDSDSSVSSDSSYSTLASDESGYSAQVRRRKLRRRRRRKNESPLLRSLSKFLPPLLALPIFLLIRVFVMWPFNFVWGVSKRGAFIVMYAQPYVMKTYHYVRENFPWSTAREAAVISLRVSAEGAKYGASASRTGTAALWSSSQVWGERAVVLCKAFGHSMAGLLASGARLCGSGIVRGALGLRDGLTWTMRAVGSILYNILVFPLRVGKFIAFLPWSMLEFARGFTGFFRDNQDTLADVIATIIGMYLIGVLLGVLLGPIAVKLGWMSYEMLDALGVAELCVSIGLLRKPGWFIWK